MLDKNGNVASTSSDDANNQNSQLWSTSNPLQILIKAAAALNPKQVIVALRASLINHCLLQFDLPHEYTSSLPLPGTSKKVQSARKKLPHELDGGLVPFPAKLCFQCNKTCRKAPLIQCDFCPLLFHADCLDPPLTALPTTKWICPAHSEHIVDQKLLSSTRITERIKLWNQFNGRIDENAVKLSFLDKAHDEVAADDAPTPDLKRIRVPESIKAMYKNPQDLAPTDVDAVEVLDPAVRRAVKRLQLVESNIEPPSREDVETWFGGVVQLQSSFAEYLTSKKSGGTGSLKGQKLNSVKKSVNEWMDDASYAWKKVDTKTDDEDKKVGADQQVKTETNDDIAQSLKAIENNLTTENSSSADELLEKLDFKLIRALALQRLNQLVPKATSEKDAFESNAAVATCSSLFRKTFVHGEVKARAILCPISMQADGSKNIAGPSFHMRYRAMTIGLSATNDLVLSQYGHCNYVSAKHACIYFDEVSFLYGLLCLPNANTSRSRTRTN